MTTQLSPASNSFLLLATVACGIVGLGGGFADATVELGVVAVLMVLIGLPHGATDVLLFNNLADNKNNKTIFGFTAAYLGLIAAYGAVWFFAPQFAFLSFLLISIYHFGQSNWGFFEIKNALLRVLLYGISGSFVLLTPLCLHFEVTMPIVEGMTGIGAAAMDYNVAIAIPRTLFVLNIWALFYAFSKQAISKKDMLFQLLGSGLLMFAFQTLPLIAGFSVYFVFWHAYPSMLAQMHFLRSKNSAFSWFDYFKNAAPTTLLAIFFIAACFWLNEYYALGYSVTQIFFVILSLFTLPHILLIEQLYARLRDLPLPHFFQRIREL